MGHNGPEKTKYIDQGVGSHIEMITVNGGVQVGFGVVEQWGDMCLVIEGKTSVFTFSNLLLKSLTEGAVRTESGSLFQYCTTLTETCSRNLEYFVDVPP